MITFKPLGNSDIEIIVKMQQDFYAIDDYPVDVTISKKLFAEFIKNENLGKSWLIFSDSEVAGFVILTFVFSFEYHGNIGFLDELYLTEKECGKGIGKKTLAFIQAEALKLKLKIIYLEVENHNENAQKLYLASNFIFHNRQLMKYTVK